MTNFNLPDRDELEIQMQKRIAELEKSNQELRAEIVALNRDITKSKRTEESLRQSEQRVRLKLKSDSPSKKIDNLELSEIIDIQATQPLIDDFYKLTHIPIGLNDLKGNVLVSVGWQDICTKFHRVHPETCKHCVESNIKLSSGVLPREFKMYKCKNNMWDVVTPIMVGDQHVGYVFAGQFFFEDEPVDYELFRSQAKKYGFNEEEYVAALEKVPRLSREAVNTGMAFLMTFSNMISQLSYSNIKLTHSLEERDILVDALRKRSAELETVLNAVPVAVYIAHDPQALHITGNRLSYEWLGVLGYTNFSKSVLEGEKPELFKLFKDGREITPEKMPSQIAAAGKEVNDCELDIVSANSEIRHVLVSARPLRDEQGNLRGSVSAFIDITERKKAEKALKKEHDNLEELVKESTAELQIAYDSLKQSERSLAEAQEIAHIGNWERDFATNEFHWSDEMYRIFGLKPQKLKVNYDTFLNYIHPDDRHYIGNAVKEALNRKTLDINFRIILASGEERIVHAKGEVVFDEKNNPVRIIGTTQDITEHEKAEEKIKILADAVESSNDAIMTGSLDGTVTSWNKGAEQIYGYSTEEILGQNASILEPDTLKGEIKQFNEKIKQGETVKNYETTRLKKDGTQINVSVTLSPVFDDSGRMIAISVIARDITDRVKAEKSLAKTEEARKKEIHHRIKNNLQVISSLLDLQAEKFSDTKVVEAFRESQNRVMSMSLIHEELYEGKETDTLNFSDYLQNLAENLFQTYRLISENIHLIMDLEESAFFDMDTAVPLGIIINELVSNSLKHAFPGRSKGEIRIELHREEKGECKNEGCRSTSFTLTVSDNGIGIPKNLNIEDLDSLGLQLVTSLVDQLDGELELKRNNGTEFTIRFTVTEKDNPISTPAPQQLID